MAVQAMGANALAAAAVAEPQQRPRAARQPIEIDTAATVDAFPARRSFAQAAPQPSLFALEAAANVVPFGPRTYPVSSGAAAAPARIKTAQPEPVRAAAPRQRTSARRSPIADDAQATLDFLPPLKTAARTLKTNAEAVIFCEAAVASPIHRATAAVLDGCMILLAYGVFLGIFQAIASPAHLSRNGLLLLGASFAVVALFYGLLFAISGTVTPGMRWTNLRMINFDGFAPDPRARAMRLAGCWMSFLTGGLGLAWSLLDEESLTWHDHISKTFPTMRESTSNVVRR